MSDRAKSTPPISPTPAPTARPAVSPVLRESFISVFQREGQETALRLLAELAYDLACEGRGSFMMGDDDLAITRSQVVGVAGDLRQASEELADAAKSLGDGGDDPEQVRVLLACADAAKLVAPIADALDAAVLAFLALGGEK